MPRASLFRLLLPGAALLTALAAAPVTATEPFVSDSAPDAPRSVKPGKAWQEEQVQLPAWPAAADLIPIRLDGPAGELRYFIDAASLRTGRDGVVRYTVVARAGSRAENVTFEGLRCDAQGKYKEYAFGNDGRFTLPEPASDWQPIVDDSAGAFRFELWRFYLCVPRLFKARSHANQLQILRSGRVPRSEGGSFISD